MRREVEMLARKALAAGKAHRRRGQGRRRPCSTAWPNAVREEGSRAPPVIEKKEGEGQS